MFAQFSDDVRNVIEIVNVECHQLGHSIADVGHLLLAMTQYETGMVFTLLSESETKLEASSLRRLLSHSTVYGSGESGRAPIYTDDLRDALNHSVRLAWEYDTGEPKLEHVLLGLLETDPATPRLLHELGVDTERLYGRLRYAMAEHVMTRS